MRMILPARRRPNVFSTPKTASAIPTTSALHRDLLIQSTLDPTVRSIEFVWRVHHGDQSAPANTLLLHRDDGRFLLDIIGARPERDPDEEEALFLGLKSEGVQLLEVEPSDIRREPRFTNARRIWNQRENCPSPRDRQRLLDTLHEHGPLSIGDLEDFANATADVEVSVCSLACNDLVSVDLDSQPLGLDTVVSLRR
jgi:hypothetical protein